MLAFLAYLRNYAQPPYLYWDENYHVASAQKYLDGVFFLEPHPPLGKLLIAAGEKIFARNARVDTSAFLKADHLDKVPEGFSFSGVRFFSAFSGFLLCLVFYLLAYELYPEPVIAALCSLLVIMDNALVLHLRGAMLEGPQLLFIAIFLLVFVRTMKTGEWNYGQSITLGLAFGLAMATKITALFLLLAYLFRLCADRFRVRSCAMVSASLLTACAVFLSVMAIHFVDARTVVENRRYEISPTYQAVLSEGRYDLGSFALFLRESLLYSKRYSLGVPKFKGDLPNENGSAPISWPFGKRSISYRWDKTEDGRVKHLRLQCNPVGWGIGFLSFLAAAVLVGSRRMYSLPLAGRQLENYRNVELFVVLYLGYMAGMIRIPRVMYLYHYFIALLLSFILSVLVFRHFYEEDIERRDGVVLLALVLLAVAQVATFLYFMPFTYGLPITAQEFSDRAWLESWRLEPVLW